MTVASSTAAMESGTMQGVVCEAQGLVIGYCFGDTETGEIIVLALLPDYEGQGVGSEMLRQVMQLLFAFDHDRLWLCASANPQIRAHGFYRKFGWHPTGTLDDHGDEILEYFKP